jgi:hypothetical protein
MNDKIVKAVLCFRSHICNQAAWIGVNSFFIRVTIFPLALPYNTVLAEVTIYPGGGGGEGRGSWLKAKIFNPLI